MRRFLLPAAALVLAVAACPRSGTPAADAGAQAAAPAPSSSSSPPRGEAADPSTRRPPHPTMASALWGEQVALRLGRELDAAGAAAGMGSGSGTGTGAKSESADARALLSQAVAALHTLEPGAETRARERAVRAWKTAPDDVTRGTALAVTAMAMVFDPTVDGYAERLTDAFGLAAYAGTVDSSDAAGQCARAVVGAAAGAVRQARALIELVASTPKLDDETRAMLALARDAVRDRSDTYFDDVAAGLRARPDSARLKAAQGDRLLELGLVDEARKLVDGAVDPALAVVAGRARVLAGDDAGAAALLQPLVDRLTGVDEPRRAEALCWLGLAQARTAATADAARATQASLALRAGWAKEAALIGATVDHVAGNLDAARKALAPLAQGTPSSTVLIERLIVERLLRVCGDAGDVACVDRASRRHRLLDVDPAPPLAARAAALAAAPAATTTTTTATDAGVGDAASPVATTAAAEAERLRDEALRIAPGPPAQQRALLAVRRAVASRCPERARATLDRLVADPELRVARALAVALQPTPLARAQQAAAALRGKGAPLAEDDLVEVIDALGGARLKDSEALFALLGKDPRARIQQAVERARADLANPEARSKRLAGGDEHTEDHDDGHDDGHDDAPRGAPGATRPHPHDGLPGGAARRPPGLPLGLPPGLPIEAAP